MNFINNKKGLRIIRRSFINFRLIQKLSAAASAVENEKKENDNNDPSDSIVFKEVA